MPVEIVDEFDTWRRIRDWQGTEGWVHQSMVQGQRGILVTGKRQALRRRPESGAPGVALVDAGVVGVLERCKSEEHTSELQSLMRTSYAVLCLKKKTMNNNH